MKASLTFTLPEESEEFEAACKGTQWAALTEDILNKLREDLRYNPKKLPEPALEYADKLREWIVEQMNEEGLKV